jgi:hypothetical protein
VIRRDAGYLPGDKLKFDTRVRPSNVSIAKAKEAKSRLVDLCLTLDVKLILYAILHDIAARRSITERVTFGINTVLRSFHNYLVEREEFGIVVCDNLPVDDQTSFFVEKFTKGLIYPDRTDKLDRVLLYSTTSINMSHVASAVDVVLGSFRYSINNPKNREAASQMMKQITKMIWADVDGDSIMPFEKGFILRPLLSKLTDDLRGRYDALIAHINRSIE